jgi:hypothetical protein
VVMLLARGHGSSMGWDLANHAFAPMGPQGPS